MAHRPLPLSPVNSPPHPRFRRIPVKNVPYPALLYYDQFAKLVPVVGSGSGSRLALDTLYTAGSRCARPVVSWLSHCHTCPADALARTRGSLELTSAATARLPPAPPAPPPPPQRRLPPPLSPPQPRQQRRRRRASPARRAGRRWRPPCRGAPTRGRTRRDPTSSCGSRQAAGTCLRRCPSPNAAAGAARRRRGRPGKRPP
mmetsp:Transcript_40034/g.126545  ORF Transcript_40034/g.126545 Transcript_40034/m.126545 type:complete len:201 (+) Transcript_40034:592-1194(+)